VCSICGTPILGVYLVDAYGNKACHHHKDQLHYCLSCGRFCDSKSTMLDNGVYVCSDCSENVPSDIDCSRIVQHIRKKYRELPIGIIPSFNLVRLSYCDWPRDHKSVGLAIRDGKSYTIRVLDCLSKTSFAEVMAHELLHLWLYDHSLVPSERITEGFCNLGSFEILSGIQTDKAKVKLQNIISNPDSIYGEGFRMVKQVYDVAGWDGVIERIKKHGS